MGIGSAGKLARLSDFISHWWDLPWEFWLLFWPLLIMTVSAYPVLMFFSVVRNNITSRLDRWFLALLFGLALYPLLFTVINAVFRVKIDAYLFYLLTAHIGGIGWFRIWRKKVDWKGAWDSWHWLVLASLALVLFLAGGLRFADTLSVDGKLCDSDPYRHYPRAQWIVETGHIAKSEPWLVGEAPIYEAQGCYVLAAILTKTAGTSMFTVWKFGSVFMGALSTIAMYLLVTYLIPGRPRRFAGVITSAALACLSVHSVRTNMGFSEAWAMPLIPPTLLMLIWSFRYFSLGAGVLYGFFYLGITLSNMIPSVYIVFFLMPFCLWQLGRMVSVDLFMAVRDSARLRLTQPEGSDETKPIDPGAPYKSWAMRWGRAFGGLGLAVVLFVAFVLIWGNTYALIPLYKGAGAHGRTTDERLISGLEQERSEQARDEFTRVDANRRRATFTEAEIARKNIADYEAYANQHGRFAAVMARMMGSFTGKATENKYAKTLYDYIGWRTLFWASLIFILLMLTPSSARNRLEPLTLWRPLRAMGGEPRGEWVHAKAFIACFFLCSMLHFIFLEDLIEMGVPAFQSKIYRFTVNIGYAVATLIGLGSGMLTDFITESTRLFYQWAEHDGHTVVAQTQPLTRAERRARDRRRQQKGKTNAPSEGNAAGDMPEAPETKTPQAVPALATNWRERFNLNDWGAWARLAVMTLGMLLTTHFMLQARTIGPWNPQTTAAEVPALEWITEKLPKGSKVFTNWFHADFVRTYSAIGGNPIESIFNNMRTDVRHGVEASQGTDHALFVPVIDSPTSAVAYIKDNPGPNYYIFRGQHGPHWNLNNSKDFALIAHFPGSGREEAYVYEYTGNSVRIPPREQTEIIAIAGSQTGSVRNMAVVYDQSIGSNEDAACAASEDTKAQYNRPTQPHWSWFGLKFPKPRTIDGARAFFGWHKDPEAVRISGRGKHPLMYIPLEYKFQYLKNNQWIDWTGAQNANNSRAYVVHENLPAVTAEGLRVYIVQPRSDLGKVSGPGTYRGACLEVGFREAGQPWPAWKGLEELEDR